MSSGGVNIHRLAAPLIRTCVGGSGAGGGGWGLYLFELSVDPVWRRALLWKSASVFKYPRDAPQCHVFIRAVDRAEIRAVVDHSRHLSCWLRPFPSATRKRALQRSAGPAQCFLASYLRPG